MNQLDPRNEQHPADFGCGHPKTHWAKDCAWLRGLRIRFDITGSEIGELEEIVVASRLTDSLMSDPAKIEPILEWMEQRIAERPDLYRKQPVPGLEENRK